MVGISENEKVLHTLCDVRAGKMISKSMTGMTREYDMFFTDNGIAFVNTMSALKSQTIRGVGSQFGIIGALAKKKAADMAKDKGRDEFKGLNLKEILEKSEHSFFVPYEEVKSVKMKPGIGTAAVMRIHKEDVSYELMFPKTLTSTGSLG